MWLGLIHHVCGQHEWADGECAHGPLVSTEEGKTFLSVDSKAHKAVRDIVMDPAWLKSLAFYVKFRYVKSVPFNFTQIIISFECPPNKRATFFSNVIWHLFLFAYFLVYVHKLKL